MAVQLKCQVCGGPIDPRMDRCQACWRRSGEIFDGRRDMPVEPPEAAPGASPAVRRRSSMGRHLDECGLFSVTCQVLLGIWSTGLMLVAGLALQDFFQGKLSQIQTAGILVGCFHLWVPAVFILGWGSLQFRPRENS